MIFDHVGFVTVAKKEDEKWVEPTRVWVTDPKAHPYSIEWLRFEADSPVTGPVRERSHVAFRVGDMEKASRGLRVLLEPFEVAGSVRVGFYQSHDGGVVELMQYPDGI